MYKNLPLPSNQILSQLAYLSTVYVSKLVVQQFYITNECIYLIICVFISYASYNLELFWYQCKIMNHLCRIFSVAN